MGVNPCGVCSCMKFELQHMVKRGSGAIVNCSSLGGLIGFVGLLVPHFLRILIGPNHVRLLLPAALGGATFLILADTFARTAFAPTEIPVGVFTAFLGGPAFLYLLNHRSRESRQ